MPRTNGEPGRRARTRTEPQTGEGRENIMGIVANGRSAWRSGTGRRPVKQNRRSFFGSSGSICSDKSSGTSQGEVPHGLGNVQLARHVHC